MKSSKISKKSSKRYSATKTVTKGGSRTQRGIQYVLPLGNGWVVKNNSASRFTAITDTKREAISIARGIARTKRIELIVHGRNGTIEIHETHRQ